MRREFGGGGMWRESAVVKLEAGGAPVGILVKREIRWVNPLRAADMAVVSMLQRSYWMEVVFKSDFMVR